MKTLIGNLVMPVICVLLGWGVFAIGGLSQSDEVRCGDRVMTVGDSCDHVSTNSTRTNTFEQEKAEQHRVSGLFTKAGLGIVGLGGLSVVWVLVSTGVRASRKKTPAQA